MKKNVQQGSHPVFLFLRDSRYRTVRFEAVMTWLVMLTCAFVWMFDVNSSRVSSVDTTVQVAKAAPRETAVQAAATPVATAPAPATPVAAPVPVAPRVTPSCQPNTQFSSSPLPLNLGQYGEGLSVVRDAISYYQIRGNTPSELRTQIHRCGPSREFAGQSGYAINWTYALRADETGLCRVMGVKVGVRTTVLLPYMETTDAGALASSWRAFVGGLTTHELGHVALTEQYGAYLVSSLQGYPAGDCYTMGPAVDALARNISSQLASRQQQYDASSDHGATQGAIW